MSEQTEPPRERLVLIEDALWWNFARWCRLHGYVVSEGRPRHAKIEGLPVTYVRRPVPGE